eukprot:431560-Alexandrium_andersonii.AAC.1
MDARARAGRPAIGAIGEQAPGTGRPVGPPACRRGHGPRKHTGGMGPPERHRGHEPRKRAGGKGPPPG